MLSRETSMPGYNPTNKSVPAIEATVSNSTAFWTPTSWACTGHADCCWQRVCTSYTSQLLQLAASIQRRHNATETKRTYMQRTYSTRHWQLRPMKARLLVRDSPRGRLFISQGNGGRCPAMKYVYKQCWILSRLCGWLLIQLIGILCSTGALCQSCGLYEIDHLYELGVTAWCMIGSLSARIFSVATIILSAKLYTCQPLVY